MDVNTMRHARLTVAAFVLALGAPLLGAQDMGNQSNRDAAAQQGTDNRDAGSRQGTATQDSMSGRTDSQAAGTQTASVASGQKMEISGVIVRRDADTITVRDDKGSTYLVALEDAPEVKEKKSNPFRRAKNYATTQLLRGLEIEVEGRGDSSGRLVAREIKFRNDDYRYAKSLDTRVNPVEGRLSETETRLGQSEQNAQRLSGQVEELSAVSNAAKGGAKAAQDTADEAVSLANNAKAGVEATNERITSLDDYDVRNSTTVHFRVGSSVLSKAAKEELDRIAEQAKTERGFIIEVTGFASSDGSEALNRRLSQRRADTVVRYLAENHDVPLRRIVTPFGYGEKQPIADNSSREGRQQNRRVEVKILVNKGMVDSANEGTTQTSEQHR